MGGKILMATSRPSCVSRADTLAHAPFAHVRGDFVSAEACAGVRATVSRDYTGGAAGADRTDP